MRRLLALLILTFAASSPGAEPDPDWHLLPGSFEPGRHPDGSRVLLDAPEGLVLVDTARHPAHQEKLLAYARSLSKPIAVIVGQRDRFCRPLR